MRPLVLVLHPSIRARAYLQRCLGEGLRPDAVVRLGHDADDQAAWRWERPVDRTFDPHESLRETIERHELHELRVPAADVNDPEVARIVAALEPELVVFTGGGILRPETLESAPRWLHVHPGRLPDRRGSTCIHYGLLLDGVIEASAMLMRPGLDDGPVLHRRRFAPRPDWDPARLDDVEDAALRARVLVETLVRWDDLQPRSQVGARRTFYVIHPALKSIALGVAREAAREAGTSLEAKLT